MSTNDTYLAVFLGSKTSARMKTWMALPEAERRAKEHEGIAGWKAWLEKHHAAVSVMGGPLGKTKKVTESGVARGHFQPASGLPRWLMCACGLSG
jgi:hypothetical protein